LLLRLDEFAGKCVSLHALKKEGTMKTAIKLVLIYFVMQILAALLVMPFAMLYSYAVSGTIDAASVIALAPSMLLGFVGMG
jgi:uncharacterized protein